MAGRPVPRASTSGRFSTEDDEDDAAAVTVLGPDTVTELFGLVGDPVGQTVTTDGIELEVIGVLEALSSSEDTSNNDVAIVPLSTYSQRLVGGDGPRLGQLDLRQGHVGGHPVGRLPGDRRHSCGTSTASPPTTTRTSRSPPRSRS